MTKIDDLIAAGEKATQATWETNYTGNIWAGGTGANNGDPDLIYKPHGHPEENHLFIVAAANAREDIKALYSENKMLKQQLQEMIDKLNDKP